MKDPVLIAENICKSYEHPAPFLLLRGISLIVQPGETIAITGRSGEGKTTLLHILGTLDTFSSGTLTIAGQEISNSNRDRLRNNHIGFIFQSFHLLEDYSALENVLMPFRIARIPIHKHSEAYERASASLEKVGLAHRMHFNTKLLSGGEKQRVGLARALVHRPSLILADEPSGNLDRHHAEKIQEILFRTAAEENKAVIIVTHDMELAARCNRHYSLKEGIFL